MLIRTLLENPKLERELKLNIEKEIYRYYEIPNKGFFSDIKRRGLLAITKSYTDYNVSKGDWDGWNHIGDGFYLGKLPSLSERQAIIDSADNQSESESESKSDTCEKSTPRPLGLIVSAVDYFEVGGNLALDPIATPQDWNDMGIQHISLPMRDFGAEVPIECLLITLDNIVACIANGKAIYDHCKAGRGRSAMLAAIYFSVFDSECYDEDPMKSLTKAIEKIKSNRHHIGLEADKLQKALATIQVIRKIHASQRNIKQAAAAERREQKSEPTHLQTREHQPIESKTVAVDLATKMAELFASTQAKIDIAQLTSFKQLAIYGASIVGQSKRTERISELFKEIHAAKDADWFLNFLSNENVQALLNATPSFTKRESVMFTMQNTDDDKKNRSELITAFHQELKRYACYKLGCSKDALDIKPTLSFSVESLSP